MNLAACWSEADFARRALSGADLIVRGADATLPSEQAPAAKLPLCPSDRDWETTQTLKI